MTDMIIRSSCLNKSIFCIGITMTLSWVQWHLKSLVSRLFTQSFIQAQIKENIKAPRHWEGNSPVTGEFPTQRSINTENVSIWWRHYVKTYPSTPHEEQIFKCGISKLKLKW